MHRKTKRHFKHAQNVYFIPNSWDGIFTLNQYGQRITNSRSIMGATHYLGDKIEIDVSSEGFLPGSHLLTPDERPLLETSNSILKVSQSFDALAISSIYT